MVWEAFVDMMNKGTENRVKIKNLLQFLTVEVEDASFVNFFKYPKQKIVSVLTPVFVFLVFGEAYKTHP